MRVSFALLFVIALGGCSGFRTAPPTSGASAAQMGRVYFQGTGSDHEVRRFHKILEIALDDNHLQRVDSSKDADAVVKATINIEEKTTFLHVPRVLATVTSNDNKRYQFQQCNGMSTRSGSYSHTADYVTFEVPQDWAQAHPHFAVYIDESKFKGHGDLIASFKKNLNEKGYKIANDPSASDGALTSIMMQMMDVPMSVLRRDIQYEVFDKNGMLYYYTSGRGATDTSYLGLTPPFKVETLPCSNQIKTYKAVDMEDGSWQEARGIAKTISERIGKTIVHSN